MRNTTKNTSYERTGNVIAVRFGNGSLPEKTSDEKVTDILSKLIAQDVEDAPTATAEVRACVKIVLSRVGTKPAAKAVQRSLLEGIVARLVKENALRNLAITRLPARWENHADLGGVREKILSLRSETKRYYRTELANLANPESAALNTRLFVEARRVLDTDWNRMRAEIMAEPIFTRVLSYLGPEYADTLLPNPAIDLPDSETQVINEFYNALTLFAHLANIVPTPRDHPEIYYLLVNTRTRLLKIYTEIRRDIMSYDASKDRSRGATQI